MNNKIIAVDFDGTIVEDAYPDIGKPKLFAFDTLKKLQSEGYRLILWTYRCGKSLEDAIKYCEKNGLYFYAVNSNYEGEIFDGSKSRKIYADIFIDDRNLGGFPGWGEVYYIIKHNISFTPDLERYLSKTKKRKSLFSRLFS